MYRQKWNTVFLACLLACGPLVAAGAAEGPVRTVTFWHSMSGGRYEAFKEIFIDPFPESFPPWIIEDEFPGRVGIALRQRMLGTEGPPDLALVDREDIPYLSLIHI